MPRSLAAIPEGEAIADQRGIITIFMRFRWQALIDAFSQSPTVALTRKTAQQAALGSTILWTVRTAGPYRIGIYLRITQAASTSSSATVTLAWVESGIAQSKTFAAVTGNTTTTTDSQSFEVEADAASNLTISVAYASVGGVPMQFRISGTVEQLV